MSRNDKEHAMKRLALITAATCTLVLAPAFAQTTSTKQTASPGATTGSVGSTHSAKKFAPGQKQTTPGSAKQFAPGQQQKLGKGPAKQFAPGHLTEGGTTSTTGSGPRSSTSGTNSPAAGGTGGTMAPSTSGSGGTGGSMGGSSGGMGGGGGGMSR